MARQARRPALVALASKVAVVTLAMAACVFQPVIAQTAPVSVLVVVAAPGVPTAMESAIAARLRTAGSTVTYVDDDTVTTTQANASTYVLISPSVASSGAAAPTRLSTSTRPLWVAKPYLLDDYGLTGPTALTHYGNVSTRAMTITSPGHPMAAGRSGTLTTFITNQTIGWGQPAASATTVATTPVNGIPRATAFAITAGDALAGGQPAPGCRLTFPFGTSTTAVSTDYWTLFDATATYAASTCTSTVVDEPPTVAITAPAPGSTVSGTTTISATAEDDVQVTAVDFAVDGVPLAQDTSGGDGWMATWNSTVASEGSHTLRAVATDNTGQQATTSVSVSVRNVPAPVSVLVVVAAPGVPTAMESAIAARLRTAGSTVTYVDDDTVTTTQANASTYVLISPSVASSGAAAPTRLSTSTRPLWVAKPYLLDDYGLTGPTALTHYGNVSTRAMTITSPGHPMAAGRSGTLTTFITNQTIGWGQPAASATTVATTPVNGIPRATAFAITAGDALAGGQPAPGCRLTFPFGTSTTAVSTDYWTLFDATATYAASTCTSSTTPHPEPGRLVLLVSVDGLNPDAIRTLGPTGTPTLHRLMADGASTLNARSVVESTQTLPNHSSMLTSRPVTAAGGHRVLFNEDNGGTIHATAGTYIAGAFDVVHDAGLRTAMYSGKAKLAFLDRSWDSVNGAPDTTGPDDGADKVDSYTRSTGAANTSAVVSALATGMDGFTFVHYAEPDAAGHASGYMSQAYLDAVARVDGYLSQLVGAIVGDPALAARTTLLVTSDHGGFGLSHADETAAVNYTVPFLAWGTGVAHGVDLYSLNADRAVPGTAQPSYDQPAQPVRSAEIGNLVTELLGLGVVPGSRINTLQDLDLTTEHGIFGPTP